MTTIGVYRITGKRIEFFYFPREAQKQCNYNMLQLFWVLKIRCLPQQNTNHTSMLQRFSFPKYGNFKDDSSPVKMDWAQYLPIEP